MEERIRGHPSPPQNLSPRSPGIVDNYLTDDLQNITPDYPPPTSLAIKPVKKETPIPKNNPSSGAALSPSPNEQKIKEQREDPTKSILKQIPKPPSAAACGHIPTRSLCRLISTRSQRARMEPGGARIYHRARTAINLTRAISLLLAGGIHENVIQDVSVLFAT